MSNNTARLNVLIGGNATQFYQTIGGVQRTLNGLSKNLDLIAKNISTNVSLPLAVLGGVATNTAATFSDSMLKVKGLTSATGDEFDLLTLKAKELGANTAFSASQAADAMGFMALAGWDTNKILAAIPDTLNLASAAGGDLATVTDILTDTMSAYNLQADQAGRISDVFAKAQGKSNTSVLQLGEAFKYSAANASAANQSIEDTSAVLAVMANAGIKGSSAGTSFNAMLRDMKKHSIDGAVAIGAVKVALYDQDGAMRSIIDVMQDVEAATKNLTQQDKDAALMAVFKEESIRGVNTILNAGTKELTRYQSELINSNGYAKEFAATMESGLGGAIRLIKSSIESIAITIGENLTPYIQKAGQYINGFANTFNNLNPTIQSTATAVGVILAVLPPLIVGFGQVIKIVTSSINAIKVLIPLLSGVSLPVLAVAAAIGAAVVLVITYWDELKAYFTTGGGVVFMDSLKQLWDATVKSISDAVSQLVNVTKGLWETYGNDITDIFKALAGIVTTQLSSIIEFVSLAIRGTATVLTAFSKVIRGDFKGAFASIKNFAVDAFITITSVILSSFQSVLGVASTVAEKLGFDTVAKGIDTATQKLENFKKAFKTVAETSQNTDTSLTINPESQSLQPESSNVLETGSSSGVGSIKKTIEAIKLVKTEFDITSSFAGKKIDEIGKKVMDAGVSMYEALKNVSFSFDEYMKYFHEFQNGTYVALEGFMVLGDGIQDVFVNLLESGKLSFQGLFKQISLFIAKMIGAIAAAAILSVLVSSIFGGASAIGSAFSFGNLAAQFSGGLLNFAGGKANGGNVDMGSAYMVGERGRELFVPNTSGTIIANDKLGTGTSKVEITGVLTASGSDLKYVLDKENKRRSKI